MTQNHLSQDEAKQREALEIEKEHNKDAPQVESKTLWETIDEYEGQEIPEREDSDGDSEEVPTSTECVLCGNEIEFCDTTGLIKSSGKGCKCSANLIMACSCDVCGGKKKTMATAGQTQEAEEFDLATSFNTKVSVGQYIRGLNPEYLSNGIFGDDAGDVDEQQTLRDAIEDDLKKAVKADKDETDLILFVSSQSGKYYDETDGLAEDKLETAKILWASGPKNKQRVDFDKIKEVIEDRYDEESEDDDDEVESFNDAEEEAEEEEAEEDEEEEEATEQPPMEIPPIIFGEEENTLAREDGTVLLPADGRNTRMKNLMAQNERLRNENQRLEEASRQVRRLREENDELKKDAALDDEIMNLISSDPIGSVADPSSARINLNE